MKRNLGGLNESVNHMEDLFLTEGLHGDVDCALKIMLQKSGIYK